MKRRSIIGVTSIHGVQAGVPSMHVRPHRDPVEINSLPSLQLRPSGQPGKPSTPPAQNVAPQDAPGSGKKK